MSMKNGQKTLDGFSFFRQPIRAMEQAIHNQLIRCPRLGDEMTFSYCLRESGELPCARIVRCWSLIFDVEYFLKETLGQEKWICFVNAKPADKMTSLLELIEAAKAKS